VILCIEIIYGPKYGEAFVSTADDLKYYTDHFNSPYVGICLDTGHSIIRGQDPLEMLRTLGKAVKVKAGEESDSHVAIESAAETNARIKYHVVMQDEREKGMREILNLGHTAGRALETAAGYTLLHGEAVAVGMMVQLKLGLAHGFVTEEEAARVEALLQKAGLPVRVPAEINPEELVKKLYTDKKVRGGKLRFVFQKGIGEMMCFGDDVYSMEITEEEARRAILSLC